MRNHNEGEGIDFDKLLIDIQLENTNRLKEIMEEPLPDIPTELIFSESESKSRLISIIDIFIPPGAK